MANWNGAARTNYFVCTDKNVLARSLEPFDIIISEGASDNAGKVCLLSTDESGGWPGTGYIDGEKGDIDFDMDVHVMPYVCEGEVVVAMEAGAEKLRYVSGLAEARIRKGDEVKVCAIHLNDIYDLAARHFGVDKKNITIAEY